MCISSLLCIEFVLEIFLQPLGKEIKIPKDATEDWTSEGDRRSWRRLLQIHRKHCKKREASNGRVDVKPTRANRKRDLRHGPRHNSVDCVLNRWL